MQKGERVGIWSPNRYEWVVVQYATARIGAILVNINPAYKATELEYVLNQSGISVPAARARLPPDRLRAACSPRSAASCPDLRWSLVHRRRLGQRFNRKGDSVAEAELDEARGDAAVRRRHQHPVHLRHHRLPQGRHALAPQHPQQRLLRRPGAAATPRRDRVCIPVPFYHCFGMVLGNLACTAHGACMVVPAEAYDPLTVLEAIQAERCTSLYGVPTMFIAELDHPRFAEFDLLVAAHRHHGRRALPHRADAARSSTRLHMPEVAIGYGMTETSPHLDAERRATTRSSAASAPWAGCSRTARSRSSIRRRAGSCRAARPASSARAATASCSATGTTRRRRQPSIDAAGWMHSGDLATMDDEGYVNIVGRIKDMIIRGGENIYPREIEEFLHTHPGVSEAQVIGVPSLKYGEEVMAWIKPKPGATLTRGGAGRASARARSRPTRCRATGSSWTRSR